MNSRQWSHSLLQRQLAQGVCQEKGQFFLGMRREAFFRDLAGQYSAKQCLIMVREESGPCDPG